MGKIGRDIEERDPKRSIGFLVSPVLPGEDQKEFQCLLDELCEQYVPTGPVEKDAVQTMARVIFRKRHPEIFQRSFEARMKWGSFFTFPGDTKGFERIAEQCRQRVNAMYIDMTTKYATERVEHELAKFASDGAEKAKLISGEAVIADEMVNTSATYDRKESRERNGDPSVEGYFEEIVENIVEGAIAEIKREGTAKPNRRAMRSESTAEIVGRMTKAEVEAEIERLQGGIPNSFREESARMSGALDKSVAGARALLGADYTRDLLDGVGRAGTEQLLARLGDLLTPERYAADLQFNELLDRTVEACHDRLMKYQAARAKKLSGNISSLQPGWARNR
jgi:hypothetical protein